MNTKVKLAIAVAVCDKGVNWVDLDEFLVENPDFNTNMFLQTLEGYGPNE